MNEQVVRAGFLLAGIVNIVGILIVTHGMTSATIGNADPAVSSDFGIISIILWGLAYIATIPHAASSILLPAVFALEKLAYTINWAIWMGNHAASVEVIRNEDFLGGFFLGGYGINDGLFCVFFGFVAVVNLRKRAQQAGQ